MSHYLGVKFSDHGQAYYFDSGAFVVSKGRSVLVKTDQGLGLGVVVDVREEPPESVEAEEFKPIYRLANDEDMAVKEENDELARKAFVFCRDCIAERKLEMKLVDVEVYFDRSKMIFYFTAPGRIDFRDLVKDLVRQYRTRIELRQIGVRHETQMLGAMGNCGQVCCCRRFMRKFHPVTIKMAKEQNLFLNPTKISGICGRLLCCLGFEQKNYEEFHRECPKIGKKFTTSLGRVKVLRSNFFKQNLSILTENGDDHEVSLDEWRRIVNMEPPQEVQETRRSGPARSGRRTPPPHKGREDGGDAPGGEAGTDSGGVFGLGPGSRRESASDEGGEGRPRRKGASKSSGRGKGKRPGRGQSRSSGKSSGERASGKSSGTEGRDEAGSGAGDSGKEGKSSSKKSRRSGRRSGSRRPRPKAQTEDGKDGGAPSKSGSRRRSGRKRKPSDKQSGKPAAKPAGKTSGEQS